MKKNHTPGLIVLLGSGETLPSSGKTHEYVAKRLPKDPRIVILETPAGFEPNSDAVAYNIKEFLERRLQNYNPTIEVVPARKKGTAFSPDDVKIVDPLLSADEILTGPGSPTYAVRQLQDSLALKMISVRHRRGSALFLSSAATLAFGTHTMPVYEIYKVGEELHWKRGLDFFGQYGLKLSVIPHWNNNDGGDKLDTSRCYLGQRRFNRLRQMLPQGETVLGIDEHTSLILNFEDGCCHVMGVGAVTVLRNGDEAVISAGSGFPMELLGDWHIPKGHTGLDEEVWEAAIRAEMERAQQRVEKPPVEVLDLVKARENARLAKAWDKADALRDQISALGWDVQDTPNGSDVFRLG